MLQPRGGYPRILAAGLPHKQMTVFLSGSVTQCHAMHQPFNLSLACLVVSLCRVGGKNCVCSSLLNAGLEVLCKRRGHWAATKYQQLLVSADLGWIQPDDLDARGHVSYYWTLQPSCHSSINTWDVQGWSGVWDILVSFVCLEKFCHCSNQYILAGQTVGWHAVFFFLVCSVDVGIHLCWCLV